MDEDGSKLGIMPIERAVALAEEREMDLVEINPKGTPPVARIIDYSEFKYQKEKEVRKQKAHAHVSEIKGVRLSMRIGDHDLEIKKEQSKKFLERGDKVKVELILRGREHGKVDIAFDIVRQFVTLVGSELPVRVEQDVTRQGHKLTAIIAKK
ncbi:MAG: Translation initiation factor IF-3 [Candidatus Magasanikbacteria bacterium GW2011_GWA2_56_11]|uniref:Translation initiation factor IF-3 n=1 Tax=Candidatus Magasanikbacteria bacterium GW2011_GWA2_56_11 TaxID=1619044 RepID=A0A0G1YEB7_9BACT|nr:MAG: Translation initiation factor IF-3 [Candidatus Magasanikbacteria bacterium GW2011_GWA2_56_11]